MFMKRISANDEHVVLADSMVYLFFISNELIPILSFNPSRVTGYSQPVITRGHGTLELINPGIKDSFTIENIAFEIPIGMRDNFYLFVRQILREIRYSLPHGFFGFFFAEGL